MIFLPRFDFSLRHRLKIKLFGIFQNFIEDNFLIFLPFDTNICENVEISIRLRRIDPRPVGKD